MRDRFLALCAVAILMPDLAFAAAASSSKLPAASRIPTASSSDQELAATAPAPSSTQLLSLADCLRLALQFSPQRIIGILQAEKAQKALKEWTAKRLPHLWAYAANQQSNDASIQNVATNYDFIHLQQDINPFDALWKTGTQRRKELDAAVAGRIASKLDVELLVKTLYFSILQSSDSITMMNRVEKQLYRLQLSVLPRYTVGRAPPFDLLNVRTQLSDLKLNRDLTRAGMSGGQELLALIVGKAGGDEIILGPIKSLPDVPPNEDVLKNPSLESLRAQVRAAKWALRAQRAEWLPQMNVGLDYGYGGIEPWHYKNFMQTFAPSWGHGGQVDLNITQQLFNWGEINARIAQKQKDLDIAQMNYKNQYQSLRQAYVSARIRAAAHRSDDERRRHLFSVARLAADTSIDRYQREATTILEAAGAVSFWMQTLITERTDYYSYLTDVATIERLIGQDVVNYGAVR